jgi:hypothetical protein
VGLILSRDHIHTVTAGVSHEATPPWPLYAFATYAKWDITGGCLMNIVRNLYPVLKKEAVGFCEILQTVYFDLFVHSLVQSE